MLNPSAHEGMDPYHFQEWHVEEFHHFLAQHFAAVEIRWHVMLESGKVKSRRNAERYHFAPVWLKTAVKTVMGHSAAVRFSQKGAEFYDVGDYAWARERTDTALEFVGISHRSCGAAR